MVIRAVMVEDLGVELRCCMYATIMNQLGPQATAFVASRDIAVNKLSHGCETLVGHDVEHHCLDIGTVHCLPFQVVTCQFSELRGLGGDRLNG